MKKFLKLFIVTIIALLSFSFINVNTSADTGPKPYVSVSIEGDTKGMYMTLLSKKESTGPFSTKNKHRYTEEDEVYVKFSLYEDKDGFFYLNYHQSIENGTFKWGYYPPYTFKFLIYDSINDRFITDDVIYERYAFGSTYKIVLNDNITSGEDITNSVANRPLTVYQQKQIKNEIINFFVRLIICLSIEIAIALLFKFRKLELVIILIANLVTQIILNVLLSVYIYYNGYQVFYVIFFYVISELLVLFIEFVAYNTLIYLVDKKKSYPIKSIKRILLYTVVANVASLVLGFIILTYLPFFG